MWKANKFVNILLWVLAIVSVALCGYAFIGCGNLDVVTQVPEMMEVINPMLVWSYILIGIAAVLTIFLPIPQMIENPKSAIGILVGILAFVVVVGVSYLFASEYLDPRLILPGQEVPSEGTVKFSDVNLISTYIMLGATILVTLASSVVNFLKLR
ncbi:MAG: hypothetical protein LBK58_14690 [Prevotellaceae bacterium]|jgi:hypothetical protein|nr:hypothetical protein [Prevotellaceae bacterium]